MVRYLSISISRSKNSFDFWKHPTRFISSYPKAFNTMTYAKRTSQISFLFSIIFICDCNICIFVTLMQKKLISRFSKTSATRKEGIPISLSLSLSLPSLSNFLPSLNTPLIILLEEIKYMSPRVQRTAPSIQLTLLNGK